MRYIVYNVCIYVRHIIDRPNFFNGQDVCTGLEPMQEQVSEAEPMHEEQVPEPMSSPLPDRESSPRSLMPVPEPLKEPVPEPTNQSEPQTPTKQSEPVEQTTTTQTPPATQNELGNTPPAAPASKRKFPIPTLISPHGKEKKKNGQARLSFCLDLQKTVQ